MLVVTFAVIVAAVVLAVVVANTRRYVRVTRSRDVLDDTPARTRPDRVQAELYPLPPLEARATTRRPPRNAA